jgi:hypothetical protein
MSQHYRSTIMFLRCLWLFLFFQVGSGLPGQAQKKQKQGLHDLVGWNGAWVNPSTNVANSATISGEVGHELELAQPTADCVSPTKTWTSLLRIISGELPPGIYIEGVSIKGTPEQRGHYIVEVENYDIKCNNTDYGTIRQELRFHITGSGKVNKGEKKELISDEKVKVYYQVSKNDVKFFMETKDFASIKVDVNGNGVVDERLDRSYGMGTAKLLCATYLIAETRSTQCGQAPTKAKLSVGSSVSVFTIPINELTTETANGVIHISISIYTEATGTRTKYPAGVGIFGEVYKIGVK